MTLPEGTRGRLVAVGLLLIPLILLFQLGLRPIYQAYFATGGQIEDTQLDIARYQRIIAELPGLKANMARFSQQRPLAPYLLEGGNATLAAAGLQRRLQELAGEHRLQVISVRVQPPAPDGPLERISVQTRLNTDTRGLRNLLYALEANRPFIFVDKLTVSARPRRRNTGADVLEIRLSLSGLRRPNATETPIDANG